MRSVALLPLLVAPLQSVSQVGGREVVPFPAPSDRGVAVARHLPDLALSAATGEYGANTFGAAGQSALSWDGLIRFAAKTIDEGATQYYGLTAQIIDYANFEQHANGRLGFAYRGEFPVWKSLWHHSPSGVYATDVTQPYEDWEIALDDPLHNPSGVGTGLTKLNHTVIVPSPERAGENPYLSDASGGAADGSLHMTYDFLMLVTVAGAPKAHDADAQVAHEFHATDTRRRLVTGLGKVTVAFASGAGGQRVPTSITAAGVDPTTFGVLQTPGSSPSARTVVRGYESAITRDGNVIVFHSQLYDYFSDPAAPAPSNGHVLFARRLQGSFSAPDDPVLPLRFSEPEPLSSLFAYRDAVVPMMYTADPDPRPPITYGERYPLFRHQLMSPLGDHVYAPGEPVGGAYPWISLDGSYLMLSTTKGVGDYLDYNAVTQAVQTSGGIDHCLAGPSCSNPAAYKPSPRRRAGFAIVGEGLVVSDGTDDFQQIEILDHPLNEARRSLARTFLAGFRLDGPWSPLHRLPRAHFDGALVRPESNLTMILARVNNQGGGVPFLGQLDALYAEVARPEGLGHYLLYSGLIASGPWLPDLFLDPNNPGQPPPGQPPVPPPPANYSRYGTTFLTDFTRAVDVSGNGLRVDLGYGGAGAGGAFYPYNDPVGAYLGPLLDHARELQIGRVGQGVYLSSDGEITISEGVGSTPGSLSDYDDQLAVHFWVRLLRNQGGLRLARGPAYSLKVTGDRALRVTSRARDAGGQTVARSALVNVHFARDEWYHVLVNTRVDVVAGTHALEVFVNGQRMLSSEKPTSAVALQKGPTPTTFGPGGPGLVNDRALVLDEIALAKHCLSADEARVAAMVREPRVDSGPGGTNVLGPLSSRIDAAGLDPDEAYVPADNPVTESKIDLGRMLFFDRRLSSNGTLSCGDCHQPAYGFGDPDPLGTSVGVGGQRGTRHTPHIVNRVFQRPGDRFFWDGRAASLEEQVLEPIQDPIEMGSSLAAAVGVVHSNPSDYDAAVGAAFGHGAAAFDETDLARALATYVRSLVVGDAPLDRYLRGDHTALTPSQQNGLGVFQTNCIACHHGANLSDNGFHDAGLYDLTAAAPDLGRFEISGRDMDRGAFKTPGLRDLDRRSTLLGHDGSLDVAAVVENYSAGGFFGQPANFVRALHLTPQQRAELEDFLVHGLVSGYDAVYAETSPWP
jgi:cytochrome c peroxidase